MNLLPDRPYQLPCFHWQHWHFLGTFESLYQVCGTDGRKLLRSATMRKTQNPNQVSLNSKAQPLQITSPADLLLDKTNTKCVLLQHCLFVFSSCDTSEPSYTKQSLINQKAFKHGNSVPRTPSQTLHHD